MFLVCTESISSIDKLVAELLPLQNCYKFDLLCVFWKGLQLSPLIWQNPMDAKEQKLFYIYSSMCAEISKQIGYSNRELLPFF